MVSLKRFYAHTHTHTHTHTHSETTDIAGKKNNYFYTAGYTLSILRFTIHIHIPCNARLSCGRPMKTADTHITPVDIQHGSCVGLLGLGDGLSVLLDLPATHLNTVKPAITMGAWDLLHKKHPGPSLKWGYPLHTNWLGSVIAMGLPPSNKLAGISHYNQTSSFKKTVWNH